MRDNKASRMDSEDYLSRLLPHRLDAVAIAVLMLKFTLRWEEPKPTQIFVEGRLHFEGQTTMFTNPALEVGVLHARALLEFIGLKVNSGGRLIQLPANSRQADDAAIENITGPAGALSLVSPDDAGAIYPIDAESARHALAGLIVAAHKGLAHSSATYFSSPGDASEIMFALQLTQQLVERFVYAPLGRLRPPLPVEAKARVIPSPRSSESTMAADRTLCWRYEVNSHHSAPSLLPGSSVGVNI